MTVIAWILLVDMILSIPLSFLMNESRRPLTSIELATKMAVGVFYVVGLLGVLT